MSLCVIPCGKIESLVRGAVNISTSTLGRRPPWREREYRRSCVGRLKPMLLVCQRISAELSQNYFVERYHL